MEGKKAESQKAVVSLCSYSWICKIEGRRTKYERRKVVQRTLLHIVFLAPRFRSRKDNVECRTQNQNNGMVLAKEQ